MRPKTSLAIQHRPLAPGTSPSSLVLDGEGPALHKLRTNKKTLSATRLDHAAVVALDRVVAVIFNQRTLDAIGRRDAHVLSTIVRAASSSGHDQL